MLSEKNFQHSLCSWWDSCDQGVSCDQEFLAKRAAKPREAERENVSTVLLAPPPKQYRQYSNSNPASYSGYFQQNVMNYAVLEKNW